MQRLKRLARKRISAGEQMEDVSEREQRMSNNTDAGAGAGGVGNAGCGSGCCYCCSCSCSGDAGAVDGGEGLVASEEGDGGGMWRMMRLRETTMRWKRS